LTKADLVEAIATEFELSKRKSGEIIELVLEEIKAALQSGEKVQLIPFGSFLVRDRKAREGRNPKTGAKIKIPRAACPHLVPVRVCATPSPAARRRAGRSSPR